MIKSGRRHCAIRPATTATRRSLGTSGAKGAPASSCIPSPSPARRLLSAPGAGLPSLCSGTTTF
uniref:Uncharacterized protein n=1 Tax=Triticum urartu TaxID=4572 RepID=A0A8R7QS65_TRIUA